MVDTEQREPRACARQGRCSMRVLPGDLQRNSQPPVPSVSKCAHFKLASLLLICTFGHSLSDTHWLGTTITGLMHLVFPAFDPCHSIRVRILIRIHSFTRFRSNPGSVSKYTSVQTSCVVLCSCWCSTVTATVSSLPRREYLALFQRLP